MGGRLDAVNAIDPDLAIITAIGYDHQTYLGNTLEDIATEKAGILRPQIPLVLSEKSTLGNVLLRAQALQNALYIEGRDFAVTSDKQWRSQTEVIELAESHLPKNSVALAFAAYTVLRDRETLSLPPLQEVAAVLVGLSMVGRYQEMKWDDRLVILDVGHNADASCWLAERLMRSQSGKVRAVWASLNDKDLAAIVAPFKGLITKWYVGQLSGERATPCDTLSAVLMQQGMKMVQTFSSIVQAFKQAVSEAEMDEDIIVFGSFHTVGAVLEAIGMNRPLGNFGLIAN
jgi:dihydrofolate synthase/folylpolyglutamate synthase